jgi:RNA-directed DNA polymerase
VQTSKKSIIVREIGELLERRNKQMTMTTVGAPLTKHLTWQTIQWTTVKYRIRKLQLRIAKAIRSGRQTKARALQLLLTHSFYAKLLAVRRVTQNRGKNTPGVDRVVWKTPKEKWKV